MEVSVQQILSSIYSLSACCFSAIVGRVVLSTDRMGLYDFKDAFEQTSLRSQWRQTGANLDSQDRTKMRKMKRDGAIALKEDQREVVCPLNRRQWKTVR